jgi:hypothetical protein
MEKGFERRKLKTKDKSKKTKVNTLIGRLLTGGKLVTINSLKTLLQLNFSQWLIDWSCSKEYAFVKDNFIYRN